MLRRRFENSVLTLLSGNYSDASGSGLAAFCRAPKDLVETHQK